MFYPGSFIWNRIRQGWLLTRTAALAFAGFAVVVIAMSYFIFFVQMDREKAGLFSQIVLGSAGVLGSFGFFFLWGGMWKFWMDHDSHSRPIRRIWFAILLLGVCYGAILYYLFVYLGQTQLRAAGSGGAHEKI